MQVTTLLPSSKWVLSHRFHGALWTVGERVSTARMVVMNREDAAR